MNYFEAEDRLYDDKKYTLLLKAWETIHRKSKDVAYWSMYKLVNFKDGLELNRDIKEFKRWEKFEDNINKELLKIRKKYLEV